jgi:hypothetical protein
MLNPAMQPQYCFTGTQADIPLVSQFAEGTNLVPQGLNSYYNIAADECDRRLEVEAHAADLREALDRETSQRHGAEVRIRDLEFRNNALHRQNGQPRRDTSLLGNGANIQALLSPLEALRFAYQTSRSIAIR